MSSVYSACFSLSSPNILSPKTSEKPIMALSGVRSLGHVSEELRLVAVGGLDLAALILDLTEQSGVLNRQGRLSRKRLKELDDFRRIAARLLSIHRQRPHDP